MKAAVVIFPGSNCDHDVLHVLRNVLKVPTVSVFHHDNLPPAIDLVVLPGGFSFGDYLRCGAIAHLSPVMADVKRHAERGGFLLGICNGFQVLTESKLLPGALTRNAHRRFECRDVFLKRQGNGPFTQGVAPVIRVPIAHAEGRYQLDEAARKKLEDDQRIAFRYCDASGAIVPDANPNGAVDNIAGVYGGPRRNILGMMPHPERLSESALGGVDGRAIFEAVLASA